MLKNNTLLILVILASGFAGYKIIDNMNWRDLIRENDIKNANRAAYDAIKFKF